MIDFKYTQDFDIELDRDFFGASQLERDVQLLQIRLTGINPDFILAPFLCSSLEDFMGEFNNEATGINITNQIINSLTRDGAFRRSNLTVDSYPSDYNEISSDITYRVPSTGKSQFIYETQVVNL